MYSDITPFVIVNIFISNLVSQRYSVKILFFLFSELHMMDTTTWHKMRGQSLMLFYYQSRHQ